MGTEIIQLKVKGKGSYITRRSQNYSLFTLEYVFPYIL